MTWATDVEQYSQAAARAQRTCQARKTTRREQSETATKRNMFQHSIHHDSMP